MIKIRIRIKSDLPNRKNLTNKIIRILKVKIKIKKRKETVLEVKQQKDRVKRKEVESKKGNLLKKFFQNVKNQLEKLSSRNF